MPEREQRRRVDVADLAAPAERRGEVGRRLASTPAPGSCTGSRPDGLTRPVSTPASAGRALLAREEPAHDRGEPVGLAAECRTGRPTSSTSTTGVPVASSASSSSSWRAGQAQVGRVAALAGRAAAEQAGPVAEHGDADVGVRARRPTASAMSVVRRRRHRAARRVNVTLGRRLGRSASSTVGDLDAHRHVGVLRADVEREGVAAQHRAAASSARGPTTRDRAGPAASGSVPSLRSRTTDSLARARRASARAPVRRRGRRVGARARPARRTSPASSRPELALLQQHAAAAPGRPAPRRRRRRATASTQRLAVAVARWAARRRCPAASASRGRLAAGAGDAVQRLQEGDGEVVGDDGAVKPRCRAAGRSAASASAAAGTPSMSV